jgi:hypothetical protein
MTMLPVLALGVLSVGAVGWADDLPGPARDFVTDTCVSCHDGASRKGGLDLSDLSLATSDRASVAQWVKVYDRVRDGQMPPKASGELEPEDRQAFLDALGTVLRTADEDRARVEGRSPWRRLNRYEYEHTVRDLLGAPWLQIRDQLPEDGEASRFNKLGEALAISHIQLARCLGAAETALKAVTADRVERPESTIRRYYARDQEYLIDRMKFGPFNQSPERATFPLLDCTAQREVIDEKAPVSVGKSDPAVREREAFGVVASSYEPLEPRFDAFRAPRSGRYLLRFSALTFWAGPNPNPKRWWIPDRYTASKGRTREPVVVSSELPPRQQRMLGRFEVGPEPEVHELDVWLLEGETILMDAARLFRSRPPAWQNPLATPEGSPGVAYRWLEVEGPIAETWPPAGHQAQFGTLPLRDGTGGQIEVVTDNPRGDADQLMRGFLARAYRHPVGPDEVARFLPIVESELARGSSFVDAMQAGYSAVLCSPEFLGLTESPGRLDDHALAARLSYFLWNSPPDEALRSQADRGLLGSEAGVLASQVDRMLDDPKSRRFVEAFLDYWLDLRKLTATTPDERMYPDYYLDDLLVDSAGEETRQYFAEMLRADLPARVAVASDFTFLNDRLAEHYGLPKPGGWELRKVVLPPDSVRGGFLTQASVLKVTANGTTTSPVVRGAWVQERLMGRPPSPPPPGITAVEPDIRGAATIREQLSKHRSASACASCHAGIDPPGFALEAFDVAGGARTRYRALSDTDFEPGFGKNGQPFRFRAALPVDCTGELADGRDFEDVRGLKALLVSEERQIARNLLNQLVTYATGTPIRFGDREEAERILYQTEAGGYGTRSLIHALIQSDLFRCK